jgi:hypothetical protein
MINFTNDLFFQITSFLTIRECYVLGNTCKFLRNELLENKVIAKKQSDFILPFYVKNPRIWSTDEGCFDWSFFIEMMKLNALQQYLNILISCNEKDVICWLKHLIPNSFIYKKKQNSLKIVSQFNHECISRIFKYHHQSIVKYLKINKNWKQINFQDFNFSQGIQKIKISQQLLISSNLFIFCNIVELNLKCCFINFENSYRECKFLNLKKLTLDTIRGCISEIFLTCCSSELEFLELTNLISIGIEILEIIKNVKQLYLKEIDFDSSDTKNMFLKQICKKMNQIDSLSLHSFSLFNNSLIRDESELNRHQDFKLKYLNLSNNLISSLLHLSKLQCFQNLIYLNLSKNCLNILSLNSLKFILAKTIFLQKIDLSSNFLNGVCFIDIVIFLSKNNKNMKNIIFQDNFIIINSFIINILIQFEFKIFDLRKNLVFGINPSNIKMKWLLL